MSRAHESKIKWSPGLPHMDVREFIANELHVEGVRGSPELDAKVCAFLGATEAPYPPVTTDLDAALKLIPDGWWWHLSHLEAKIIPTTVPKDKNGRSLPWSNGALYDIYGRPRGYTEMCWSRDRLPLAVCAAMLRVQYDLPEGFAVEASLSGQIEREKRMWIERQKALKELKQ